MVSWIGHVGCVATISTENPAHFALLGTGLYIVENLNNLDLLSPLCLFLPLPPKIRDASGSPVKAVARAALIAARLLRTYNRRGTFATGR